MLNGNLGSDILRIYICGPHSTGKTTLLNDLRPHLGDVTVVEEVARGIIKNHGWSRDDFIPDKHPDVFRQLNEEILEAQIANDIKYSSSGEDFICDRALDPIIYCGYYVSEQAKEAMYKLHGIHEWLDRMRRSFVILVSPHPECITDDNVRLPSPIEELREFHAKFKQELHKNNIKYLELTQLDRQERVNIVIKELNKFRQRKDGRDIKD
ncbi:uncharacterized protein LOC132739631 [Ruditapes philippinarum]|uniref:uncharacterized protein LOC132739631 n=1 Tax=Ruditapes philippinarum TaxID=129788 RepID=UPI00295C2061|nr:uncharacterized protein LOC132739631 [Ruditapes philippinarum]